MVYQMYCKSDGAEYREGQAGRLRCLMLGQIGELWLEIRGGREHKQLAQTRYSLILELKR